MENLNSQQQAMNFAHTSGRASDYFRACMVVRDANLSFAAEALRESVQMFEVASLAEILAAFKETSTSNPPVIGMDLTRCQTDELRLFCNALSQTHPGISVVYVVTEEQFPLFRGVQLKFVMR